MVRTTPAAQQNMAVEEDAFERKASAGCLGVLILCGWLMACIATALAQDDCKDNCADRYRYTWWVIVWAIFHYTILATLAFTGMLRTSKNAMLAFTVLLTSQMMPITNLAIRAVSACYVSLDNSYYNMTGSWGGVAVTSADSLLDLCPGDVAQELSVAASGFMLMLICNFLLIIGLGIQEDPKKVDPYANSKVDPYGQEQRAPVVA